MVLQSTQTCSLQEHLRKHFLHPRQSTCERLRPCGPGCGSLFLRFVVVPKFSGDVLYAGGELSRVFRGSFATLSWKHAPTFSFTIRCRFMHVSILYFMYTIYLSLLMSCHNLSRKKKKLSRSFRQPLLKHFNGHPLLSPLQGAFDRMFDPWPSVCGVGISHGFLLFIHTTRRVVERTALRIWEHLHWTVDFLTDHKQRYSRF